MALHRPYIRQDVREQVEARAAKNEKGQFLDANTGKPIEGSYDLGHKAGHEFRTEQANAEKQGLSQEEFNDLMNNPDLYQIEDPSSNRSHMFEAKEENYDLVKEDEIEEPSTPDISTESTGTETTTNTDNTVNTDNPTETEADNSTEDTSSTDNSVDDDGGIE